MTVEYETELIIEKLRGFDPERSSTFFVEEAADRLEELHKELRREQRTAKLSIDHIERFERAQAERDELQKKLDDLVATLRRRHRIAKGLEEHFREEGNEETAEYDRARARELETLIGLVDAGSIEEAPDLAKLFDEARAGYEEWSADPDVDHRVFTDRFDELEKAIKRG